jgi:hypothetical protein
MMQKTKGIARITTGMCEARCEKGRCPHGMVSPEKCVAYRGAVSSCE